MKRIALIVLISAVLLTPLSGVVYAKYVDPSRPSVVFEPKFKIESGTYVLTEYDGHALTRGLWYDPYTRIYTLGGPNRIAEISTFPRVYEDTVEHVYDKDTQFRVTEADLNTVTDDGFFYKDTRGTLFAEGDMAVHFKNDPLPGGFPKWLLYPSKQATSGQYSFRGVPRPIDLKEATEIKNQSMYPVAQEDLVVMESSIRMELPTNSKLVDSIMYIKYERKLYAER